MNAFARSVLTVVIVSARAFAQEAAAPAPVEPGAPPAASSLAITPRFAGSAGAGAFIPGPQLNFVLFDVNGGVKFNQMFSAYLRFARTAGIGIGATASSTGGSLSLSASGFWLIGINGELALGNAFFLAAGPQLGIGGWAAMKETVSTTGGGVEAVASSGVQPGLDVRLGFGLGGSVNSETGRRNQFTLSVDLSLLYASNVVSAAASGGTQGASVSVGFGDRVSIAPTLQLGYAWR